MALSNFVPKFNDVITHTHTHTHFRPTLEVHNTSSNRFP